MPGLARLKAHADEFRDLYEHEPAGVDFDPEDDIQSSAEDSGLDSETQESPSSAGREHYGPVENSELRKQHSISLGPQYAGSRISREQSMLGGDEHYPFGSNIERQRDSEDVDWPNGDKPSGESEEESQVSFDEDDGELEDAMDNAELSNMDDDEEDDEHEEAMDSEKSKRNDSERAEIRRLISDSQKSVAAGIAQANKADAVKGEAVKRQRLTFDSFLNARIRMQQGLIATNSLATVSTEESNTATISSAFESAEMAALNLWNTLDSLRLSIEQARTGKKRKRLSALPETPSEELWKHMQDSESASLPHRDLVLKKWSAKTQPVSALPQSRRLNSAPQSTIVDALHDQLLDSSRLIARTRIPRSCAPIQAQAQAQANKANSGYSYSTSSSPAADIYDDADFYGILLKELLEQRNADAFSPHQVELASQQWRASRETKTRKNVDTKASKGRKIRYTVHEKLQNFMAPEDRGKWPERRVDELFGSLFGRKVGLGEEVEVEDDAEAEADGRAEEALMLFRG